MSIKNQKKTLFENTPRLGCAAVIRKGSKILLGIRNKEPNRGKWVLPGGGVHFLEPLRATVKREILEETGLEIEIGKEISTYEIIKNPNEHRVIIYWWAKPMSGVINPSSDLTDARFFSKEEIKAIIKNGQSTEIVVQVLRDIGWA